MLRRKRKSAYFAIWRFLICVEAGEHSRIKSGVVIAAFLFACARHKEKS